MRYSRIGDNLWSEWDGSDYPVQTGDHPFVYYTRGWASLDHHTTLRSLATTMQRDGVVDNIGVAYRLLEDAHSEQGWAVHYGGEYELMYCEDDPEDYEGDDFDEPVEITWVEIPRGE